MLKPVKPHGDTSVAFLDWAVHQRAGKHLPRNTPSGRRYSQSVPQLLRAVLSSDAFNLYSWYSACPL